MAKFDTSIDCCLTCSHLVSNPKNNRYGDMEHFCLKTGYLVSLVHKDVHKYKHLSPTGKELPCNYERK